MNDALNEMRELKAKRDAALAVIAYARACLSHDGERDYLERIYATQNALTQSPASALAKVKADALRQAVEDAEEWDETIVVTIRDMKSALLKRADRIEKEAEL